MAESLTKSVVKGSSLGLLGAGLAIPVALISTPLFLGGLGEAGFGRWGLLQGVFAALNLLSAGSFEASMYFISRDHDSGKTKKARARTRVLAFCVGIACVLGGLVLYLGPAYGLGGLLRLPEAERADFEALLPASALFWCLQFWCFWLQHLPRARHEYGILTLNQISLTVLAPLFGWLGLVLSHGDARWFLAGQAMAFGLGVLSLLMWNARHKKPLDLRPGFEKESFAEVWKYARWTLVFLLSVMLLNSSDRLLLGGYGAAALAGYTVASSLTQRVYAVTGVMTVTLLPALARIKEGVELERLQRGFSMSLRALGFIWAALLLPLAAWGDHFMAVWLKKPELAAAAYPALLLLCCGAYFGALASGCHAALLGSGRPRLAAVTGLAGAALGMALAIPALRAWGPAGAAMLGLGGNAAAFVLRAAVMERSRFSRPLLPLFAESLAGFALLALAWRLMRALAPSLSELGFSATAAVMLLGAAILMGLGVALDEWMSRLRGRLSLLESLLSLKLRA